MQLLLTSIASLARLFSLIKKASHGVFIVLMLTYCTYVSAIELQTALPQLTIKSYGEIILNNNKATFNDWSSHQLTGKVTLLQVLAASQKAADLNKRYLDQFSARFEANTNVDSATIIVSDNIPGMLGGFVKKELKKNKLLHPRAIMVNDKKALTRKNWQLPEAQAILMLLDHRGIVQSYHEGILSSEQEAMWLSKTEQLLKQAME